jgi:Domain of unknown function (DUF4760)
MDWAVIIQWLVAKSAMMEWGTVAQWLTALIAGGAFWAAMRSIGNQREIARKRAAFDFFLKTETDKDMLNSHKKFLDGVVALKEHQTKNKTMKEFSKTEFCRDIRSYLNLHELMSVGINEGVFDDDVCYSFWGDEIRKAHRDTEPLIEFVQSQLDGAFTYDELVKVDKRWLERTKTESA